MKDLATRSFNLLYSSVLETQALRQVHASNVLLALIFGQTFQEKSKPGELIRSKGSKYPIYLHLNSVDRIVELLAIDDVQFSIYHNFKMEYTYNFCAYSVIGFCDGLMCTFKEYAFDEDERTIHWKYNNHDTHESSACALTLKKPVLLENPKEGYDLNNCTDGVYKMMEYYPVSIYLSHTNYRNFIFLSGRVCTNSSGQIIDTQSS